MQIEVRKGPIHVYTRTDVRHVTSNPIHADENLDSFHAVFLLGLYLGHFSSGFRVVRLVEFCNSWPHTTETSFQLFCLGKKFPFVAFEKLPLFQNFFISLCIHDGGNTSVV